MNQGVGILTGIWTCGCCDRPFNDEAKCAEHEGFCKRADIILGNRWTCEDCGYKSPISITVAEHKSFCQGRPESEPDGNSYFCTICGHYHPDSHQCLPEPEPEVSDPQVWFCKRCGEKVIGHPRFCNHKCPGPSTLTVELTEEEREICLYGVDLWTYSGLEACEKLRAKLRPKKESVEFDVAIDNDYGAKITSELMCVWAKSVDGSIGIDYPRHIFDALIAAYHDHVDEVK